MPSLLEHEINEGTQDGRDSAVEGLALLIAAKRGHADAVGLLLEHLAEDPQRLASCSAATLEAAEYGRDGIVRLLAEKGAELDERGLAIVAFAGREECLRTVLEKVAYVPKTSSALNSALDAAMWVVHAGIVRLIQKHQMSGGNKWDAGNSTVTSDVAVLGEGSHVIGSAEQKCLPY